MTDPAGPIASQKAGFSSLGTWLKDKLMADPAGPMQSWKVVFLFLSLVIAGALVMYFGYGLWAAEPKAAQCRPAATATYTGAEKPTDDTPRITFIDPAVVTIGIAQASIQVFGDNFTQDSKVRFNDMDRMTQYGRGDQLVVPVNSADFIVPGAIVVKVVDGPKSSNAATLMVEPVGNICGEWRVFGCRIKIRQEARLILLVLFTGAFGACMTGLWSLANFLGERKLVESWFTFYLAQPFVGGGIAFIFYLVIRGGFLAGTDINSTAVNPFGLAAVAALVGMFSDKAVLKLREVSLTLLKADDTRSGKLGQLTITTGLRLREALVGDLYEETLAASGGTPPYTWAAVTPLPPWLQLDPATGKLTGTPPADAQSARYRFQVTDSTRASTTAELELPIGWTSP